MTVRHYIDDVNKALCEESLVYAQDATVVSAAAILLGTSRIKIDDCEACRAVLPTLLRSSQINAGTVLLNEAATLCESAATVLDRASRFVRKAGMGEVVVHDDSPGTTRRGLNYYICGVQQDAERMGEWLRNYLAEDTWCSHGYPPTLNGPNGICDGCDNERAHAQRCAATETQDTRILPREEPTDD